MRGWRTRDECVHVLIEKYVSEVRSERGYSHLPDLAAVVRDEPVPLRFDGAARRALLAAFRLLVVAPVWVGERDKPVGQRDTHAQRKWAWRRGMRWGDTLRRRSCSLSAKSASRQTRLRSTAAEYLRY